MMDYSSSCTCSLKDLVLARSGFILWGRSMHPSQNIRISPSSISKSGISLASAHATINSPERYDNRGLLPVFPRTTRKDVLNQNGRSIHRQLAPVNYISKPAGGDSSAARRVRARSLPGDHDPSQSHGLIASIIGLMTGVIGLLTTVLLPFLAKGDKNLLKFEEDVYEVAEVVKEVAADVEKYAETTEEISERIEGKTREEGSIHKTAELVDDFSKEVVKGAEIMQNIAEDVAQATKNVDKSVESTMDEVGGVADQNSKN